MKGSAARKTLPLLDDENIGHEGRVESDHHQSVKVWLRLLSCSTQIETEIRRRLRTEFGMTLARFDFLAQLHRHPEGLRMNALSKFLMVTGGNVTGLTDELEKEGLVTRIAELADRRSSRVALTAKGRATFEKIALVHERWVVELFSGVSVPQRDQLHDLLGRLRVQLNQNLNPQPSNPLAPDPGTSSNKNAAD